jgi:uncharacterized protein YoxC
MLNENIRKTVETMWLQDKLSVYDVGKLLSLVGEAMKNTQDSIAMPVEGAKSDVENIMASAKKVFDETRQLYNEINDESDKFLDLSDKIYNKLSHAVFAYRERIENIRPVQNTDEISQTLISLERVVSFTERCSNLTDYQWLRVVELAKALGGGSR